MEKEKTKYLMDFQDIELWKEIKILAIREGISIRQLIADCMREKIEKQR